VFKYAKELTNMCFDILQSKKRKFLYLVDESFVEVKIFASWWTFFAVAAPYNWRDLR